MRSLPRFTVLFKEFLPHHLEWLARTNGGRRHIDDRPKWPACVRSESEHREDSAGHRSDDKLTRRDHEGYAQGLDTV